MELRHRISAGKSEVPAYNSCMNSRLANRSVFNRTVPFLKFLKPQKTERSVFGILRFVAFHAIQ